MNNYWWRKSLKYAQRQRMFEGPSEGYLIALSQIVLRMADWTTYHDIVKKT